MTYKKTLLFLSVLMMFVVSLASTHVYAQTYDQGGNTSSGSNSSSSSGGGDNNSGSSNTSNSGSSSSGTGSTSNSGGTSGSGTTGGTSNTGGSRSGTPGFPNTGSGGNMPLNVAVLVASGTLAVLGIRSLAHERAARK